MQTKLVIYGTISGRGGIQNHLHWLCKGLVEKQFSILIINPIITKDKTVYFSEELKDKIEVVPLDKYSAGFSKFSSIKYFSIIRKKIKQFKPHVFYKVGTGWMPVVQSFFLESNTRKIFHEVMSGFPYNRLDPRWGVKFFFDEVIGQSRRVAETFRKSFKAKTVVGSIPAMPEPLELTAILPVATQRSIPQQKIKAALFSRLAPHKQALWLVQQWEELKEHIGELHIHGGGTEEAAIRAYIQDTGIGNRVKCFGSYPEGQKYVDLLSNYHLTLLPTIGDEGAPLVLLESMACGVPFVANGVGGIPDYGRNNDNVIISKPNNSNFLKDVIQLVRKISNGLIDQKALQSFYYNNYSFKIMQDIWVDYLRKGELSQR